MSSYDDDETGIEELRKLVNMAGYTEESAFDGFTAVETVRLLQACRALDLETLPDQLTLAERRHAAKHGRVSIECLHRLYEDAGESKTGPDWKGQ